MKKPIVKKLGVIAASVVLGVMSFNALACCSPSVPAYRTYYITHHCSLYYINGCQRVLDGKYVDQAGSALSLRKDCHGRWYREDAMGNVMYVEPRCVGTCHRYWKI